MSAKQMDDLVIEKDVQIPPKRSSYGLANAMRAMGVGDSLLYPREKRNDVASCAKRAGINVTSRLENETHVRVWRIK